MSFQFGCALKIRPLFREKEENTIHLLLAHSEEK